MPALRVRNRGTPINYSESSRTLTKRKDVGSEGSVPKKRRIDDGPKDGKGQETRSPSKAKGKEKDGEGAKEKEKDFSGVISETPLSRQKELAGGYIKAGLYSSASRVQTSGSPSGGKRKRDDWPFKLPLPIHWGEFLLSKERDFELPFDLVNLYETTGIAGDSALDEVRVNDIPCHHLSLILKLLGRFVSR